MAGWGRLSLTHYLPLGLQDQDQLGVLHSILHKKKGEGERVAALEKVICIWRQAKGLQGEPGGMGSKTEGS